MAGVYSRLDCNQHTIRLLKLLPGGQEGPIACELSVWPLGDGLDYEALSYVWGDPKVTCSVTLDGNDFQVTTNLESALRSLRLGDRPRVIWVDAICINQQDIQERNSQVRQMGDIYAKAQRVIVWLGPRSGIADEAMDQILEIGQVDHFDTLEKYKICGHGKYTNHRAEDPQDMFEPLRIYCDSAWFSRVWVVQEIALSRAALFYCGDRHITWDDLDKFTTWLQRHEECCGISLPQLAKFTLTYFRQKTEKFQVFRKYLAVNGNSMDVTTVSNMLRGLKCSDDRDRIYAFLGLADRPVVHPKYDISVADLYRQVALAHITHTGSLDILLKAEPSKDHPELSSWVPDWSAHTHFARNRFNYSLMSDFEESQFSASRKTKPVVSDLGDEGLSVRGIHFDTIWKTLPVTKWSQLHGKLGGSGMSLDRDRLLLWEKMIGVDRAPNRSYPGGGTLIDAHWRTLLANSSVDECSHSARELTSADKGDFEIWKEWLSEEQYAGYWEEKGGPISSREKAKRVAKLNHAMQYTLGDRHVFMTTKGYIGVGCREVYVGDFVCLLFGGSQPFVLRHGHTYLRETAGEPFTFFSFYGAAYVHGIMNGEAMEGVSQSNTLDFIIK